MNGDSMEIMKAISDSRAEMLKAVGELHQEFSGFKGNIEVRVGSVEKNQDKAENRQWIHSCIVFAGGLIHHDLGQWLHWRL